MLRLLAFTPFLYLIFAFSIPYKAIAQTEDSGYTCEMDNECLNDFYNVLLDKESNEEIYQYCQINYENIKSCCLNLLECQESYGKDLAQELRSDSLNTVQNSRENVLPCELNHVSAFISSLSDIQSEVCNIGVEECEIDCKNKLEEVKRVFHRCFFMLKSYSIDEFLEKAKASPSGQKECYQAQIQEQERALQEQQFKALEQRQKTFHTENKKTAESKSQDRGKKPSSFPLGAGTLAGSAVETKALQGKRSKPRFKQMSFTPESFFSEEIDIEEQDRLNANLFSASLAGQSAKASDEKNKTSEEGFFTKTVDKIESAFKKGIDLLKNILPFVDSEQELITKADQLCKAKRRLLSLSQVVYQSVKAPQIERQDEEGRRPFDDYELIKGKPAGMIVRIRKSYKIRKDGLQDKDLDFDADKLIEKFDFLLSLRVNGRLYNETLCSLENLNKEDVEYKSDLLKDEDPRETNITAEEAYCSFNWSDLKDEYIYKFISLPMKLGEPLGKEIGPVEVEIVSQLRPKNSFKSEFVKACESSEEFTVNMLEPRGFKVLFTGITPPPISECKRKDEHGQDQLIYPRTTEQDIRAYLNSEELIKDFYDMFPVSKRRPNNPEIRLLKKNNQLIFPVGNCKKGDEGLIFDSANLRNMSIGYGSDKIFYVVDSEYTNYHNLGNIVGQAHIKSPTRYIHIPFFGRTYFGYKVFAMVGFLVAGDEENGTFLHELAHTLGQRKEHYKQGKETDYCSQFTPRGKLPGKETSSSPSSGAKDSIIGIPCYNYRVTGGLVLKQDFRPRLSQEPRRQIWKLLNNQYSFMHREIPIKNRDGKYRLWIDRETFQKSLATLQNNLIIPNDFLNRIKSQVQPYPQPKVIQIGQKFSSMFNCAFQKRPVITVSGIYNKKKEEGGHLTSFSVKAYNLKNPKNPFSSGQFFIGEKKEEANHIRVQLKKHGQLEEEVVYSRVSYVETFYKDRPPEKKEKDVFSIFTSFFPSCGSFDKESYTISVKEVYMENGVKKENILINSVPVKWKEEDIETLIDRPKRK